LTIRHPGRDWVLRHLILDTHDDATKKDKTSDLSSAEFAADPQPPPRLPPIIRV
jgi:hypothetical protein